MGHLLLVTGGTRSGKSRYAVERASAGLFNRPPGIHQNLQLSMVGDDRIACVDEKEW